MPTWLAILLATVAVIATVAHFAVPPIAASKVESNLTRNGGTAKASLSALPGFRLIFRDGERIEVSGADLEINLDDEGGGGLSELDGFGEVVINLSEFRAGPFRIQSFDLTRAGDDPYEIVMTARANPADMITQVGEQLGIIGSGFVGAIAAETALGSQTLTIDVNVALDSDGGELRVVRGGGRVNGFPVGPIASVVTAAIAGTLDIAP